MEENETTQVEAGEKAAQPEGEVKAQPNVDELQKVASERQAEIDRKEVVIQQLKKDIKDLRQHGGSRAEIDSLSRKLDSVQDWFANVADDLALRMAGETEIPQRKSYKAELQANRANQPIPQADPDARRFLEYLDDEGLSLEDDSVIETIKDTKTPREALKAMKEKKRTMDKDEIEKLAEKKADERIKVAVEMALKQAGLTTGGVEKPSAAASTFAKIEQDYADGKISYQKYQKARQEQGLS